MKQNIKQRIIKNSFWGFLSATISKIGGLIFTIILARFLMPERYGIYSIVLSVAMIFVTLADLGVNLTLIKYVSLALKRNRKSIPAYYRYLLKIKFILTLSFSLLLFALSYPLAFYIFKNSSLFLPLLITSFYVFVLSFELFYTALFYSIERVEYISLKETLNQILRISLSLLLFNFVASSYYVMGIFSVLILVSLFLVFFCLFYLKKLIPELYKKPEIEINKKRVRKFVGFLTIASISTIFFSGIDSIILAFFVSPEYVGYYKAAFSMVFGIIGFMSFSNAVLLSIFAKIEKSKLENIFNQISRYLMILFIPAIFGLLVLGKYFIRLFFGYAYLPSTLPLYFLAFMIFPAVMVNLFLSLFSSEEKPQIFARLVLMACLINVALNLILIKIFVSVSPLWAAAGAGTATLLSWFFYFFASVYSSKKEFKIKFSFKPAIKPLISSLIMAGILIYSLSFIKDMSFVSGLGGVILGFLVYVLVMFLLKGLNKKDLYLLKLLFKRH